MRLRTKEARTFGDPKVMPEVVQPRIPFDFPAMISFKVRYRLNCVHVEVWSFTSLLAAGRGNYSVGR